MLLILSIFYTYASAQFISYNGLRARLPGRCHEGDFDCGLGQCLPSRQFHDGKPDCRDGSDEWCLFGQFKCGPYCVSLAHSIGCLFSSKCDGSSRQPPWCTQIKSSKCLDSRSFPCKGYGECVDWPQLMDGQKDCIDGSDEEAEYVRTLEGPLRCHFNKTNQPQPEAVINYNIRPPPPPLLKPFPCLICPPSVPAIQALPPIMFPTTPRNPFVTLIPTTQSAGPFEHIQTVPEGQGSQELFTARPIDPWNAPILPMIPTPRSTEQSIGEFFPPAIVPVGPAEAIETFTASSTTVSLPDETTQDDVKMATKPFKGHKTITHIDLNGSGTSEKTHIEIVPSGGSSEEEREESVITNTKPSVVFKTTQVTHVEKEYGESKVPTTSIEEDMYPKEDNSIVEAEFFPMTPIRPVAVLQTTRPSTILQPFNPFPTFNPQEYVPPTWPQGLIPIRPGIPMPTIWTTLTTLPDSFQPVRPVIPVSDRKPETGFGTFTLGGPDLPTIATHIIDASSKGLPMKTTTEMSSREPTTSEEELAKTTETIVTSSRAPTTSNTTTTEDASTTKSITEASTENSCLSELAEYSKSKYPSPICDCPVGMMRTGKECEAGTISTFKLHFESICGVTDIDDDEKNHIAMSKIKESFPQPSCIRTSTDDDVIVNLMCSNCSFDYFDKQLRRVNGSIVAASVKGVDGALCSDKLFNACHENANCTVLSGGTRYSCRCKKGTTDISKGLGWNCEGIPEDDDCVLLFGICLIVWLLFLFGLLFLIPLLLYCCCKLVPSCKRNRIHPTPATAFNGRNNGMKLKNGDAPLRNVAAMFTDAMNKNARGARAVAESLAMKELVERERREKVSKTPDMSQVIEVDSINEVTSPEGTVTPSSNAKRPTPSGQDKSSSPRLQGSPLATARIGETPILEKATPTFEITSYPGTPAKDNTSLQSIPIPPTPLQKKESTASVDIPRQAPAPAAIHTSDSAPSLPNLPLPLPIPITSTTADVHREAAEEEDDGPQSARSIGVQPTMWETFRVLGPYPSNEQIGRQGSGSSLETLIQARFPAIEVKTPVSDLPRKTTEPPPLKDSFTKADNQKASTISLPVDIGLPRKESSENLTNSSSRSAKLAEMLGVTLESSETDDNKDQKLKCSAIDHNIEDQSDAHALMEMAERKIDLNISPRTDSARELKERLDATGSTRMEESLMEQEPKKKESIKNTDVMEIDDIATPLPVEVPICPDVSTEIRRKEQTITRYSTKLQKPNQSPTTKRREIPKPKVFVPKRAREATAVTTQPLSKFREPPTTSRVPPTNNNYLQPPPGPDPSSSTDESDPEVSFFKRVAGMKERERELNPFRERRRKNRKPERQLSSISEKSAEIAAEAALQEYNKDYSVSAPNTTRSLSDWHGFLPRNQRFDYVSTEANSNEILPKSIRRNIVSSPEIPDVSKRRSMERLDKFHDLEIEKRAREESKKLERPAGISKSDSQSTLKSSKRELPPVRQGRPPKTGDGRRPPTVEGSRRPPRTSQSTREQTTVRGSRQSLISRKIATRKHEVEVSQSARDLSFLPELDTRTGLRTQQRLARSVDNVGGRRGWDRSPYREGDTRESFLPSIAKGSRSVFNSPTRSLSRKRTGSHASSHSLVAARSGSSQDLSPHFDSGDVYKPPKEELWWGPPMR